MTSTKSTLVSIVFPTLNAGAHLRAALDSCLNQSYRDLEVLVIDGGSTDDTLQILESYSDPRLSVFHQADNSGRLPGALNLGFAQSSGAYLTWMQADDLYELDAIESMVRYLDERPAVDFVYCDYWWIDHEGSRLRTSQVGPSAELRFHNPIGQCFLYRRAVYEDVGEYDPAFYMAEDYEYWIRISFKHKMELYPKLAYSHRWWDDSLTVKSYGRFTAARVAARARRKWYRTSSLEFRRDVAKTNIEEMFARHADGDEVGYRRSLMLGLVGDPTWLRNRGVTSILLEAFLGRRAMGYARALARRGRDTSRRLANGLPLWSR